MRTRGITGELVELIGVNAAPARRTTPPAPRADPIDEIVNQRTKERQRIKDALKGSGVVGIQQVETGRVTLVKLAVPYWEK